MSNAGIELEDAIMDAIQDCCRSEEDKKEALRYFQDITINELIEEVLEE